MSRVPFLDRLPSERGGAIARLLWAAALASFAIGIGTRIAGFGFVALWAFVVMAVALALVLPFPYALSSPLFAGLAGWVVDMLPFVVLVGWSAVVLRWAVPLLLARRLPRGGLFRWIAVALVVWTAVGVIVVPGRDLKAFALVLGIQGLASGVILAGIDKLRTHEDRVKALAALLVYVIALSAGVLMQWGGINLDAFQDTTVADRAEAAYGVDAFPNSLGMIKWARSTSSGAGELRQALDRLAESEPGLPPVEAFRPKFQAYSGLLIVRFDGSARAYEDQLEDLRIDLVHDNLGFAPANTVPRMRSFPRNALTFAGVAAALFLPAFALAFGDGRLRRLGWLAVVAALFGVGFSLARGAWIAVVIGLVYLFVDGRVDRSLKLKVAGSLLAGAVVLSGTYLIKYGVDPVTGRAGGGASVNTRDSLYGDTIGTLRGKHILFGYGTTQARTDTGTTRAGTVGRRYVPRAGTHSTYLNYLFRTGVPGALLILALYGAAFLHGRTAAISARGRERLFAVFVTAGVVAAAAHGVILSLYVEPIYILCVSLLLALAVAGSPEPGLFRRWGWQRKLGDL